MNIDYLIYILQEQQQVYEGTYVQLTHKTANDIIECLELLQQLREEVRNEAMQLD